MGTLVLLGVVAFQIRQDRYIPWVYWLAVLLVAIVGTMAADVLHKQFGVPYVASSIFFAVGARGGLPGVAPGRGDAVDPQHRHHAP